MGYLFPLVSRNLGCPSWNNLFLIVQGAELYKNCAIMSIDDSIGSMKGEAKMQASSLAEEMRNEIVSRLNRLRSV